jgi:hypothetical protein
VASLLDLGVDHATDIIGGSQVLFPPAAATGRT